MSAIPSAGVGQDRGAWAPPASPWPPLGGALTASFLVHALLAIAIASIVTRPIGTRAQASGQIPIVALLVGAPAAVDAPPAAEPRAPALAAPVRSPRKAPPPPSPPAAATPAPFPAPWSALPLSVPPPPSLFSRPMVSEGVELVETRSLALLGETAERRIRARFDVEAKDPVKLKPPDTIGYPVDAFEAGIEGTVLGWIGVDENGEVVDKDVLDGPPELMEWVRERLDRLVEAPARVGQKGVPGWVAFEIRFTRTDAAHAAARAYGATPPDPAEAGAVRAP